jgi:hypothetical protein
LVRAIEIRDSVTGESRVIEKPSLEPRADHTATLLTDGKILIAGGAGGRDNTIRRDAEVWDPDTGEVYRVNGLLSSVGSERRATLEADGSVVLSSAAPVSSNPGDGTVDRFDPIARQLSAMSSAEYTILRQSNSASVESIQPSADATDAPVETRVAIRLGQLLASGELPDGAVTLVGPAGAVDAKAIVAEGGRLIFLTPQSELLPSATYTVFLNGLVSVDAQRIPFTTSTFTTRGLDPDDRVPSAVGRGSVGSKQSGGRLLKQTAAASSTDSTDSGSRSKSQLKSGSKAESPTKKDDADGDDVEDWIPGPEHRHGAWRVLGMAREPHTRKAVSLAHLATAPEGTTALSGRVVRLNGRPLQNVPVRIGQVATTTDAEGRFLLQDVPAGPHRLSVEGNNVAIGGRRYLTHFLRVELSEGKTTKLVEPIYLAREDNAHSATFASPTDREIVLTHPSIPGLELHVPKGVVLRSPDGKIVTHLSITPLPVNPPCQCRERHLPGAI